MLQRDVSFWDRIAAHPAVSDRIFVGCDPVSLAPLVTDERTFPLAATHGGAIFSPLDKFGLIYEMHTLFTPEGWGREVHAHAKECFRMMMGLASLIVTEEQEGEPLTRPPLSFGWSAAGDFHEVGLSRRLRLWKLTPESWRASPVGRKLCLS